MTIRWRVSAVNDLAHIRDYIADHDPAAANAVVERILRSVDRLTIFPDSEAGMTKLDLCGIRRPALLDCAALSNVP